MRREYSIITIQINGRKFNKIIIDPHVDKHADHINDEIVIELVYKLKNKVFIPTSLQHEFDYYAAIIKLNDTHYKLVWLTSRTEDFIGIITAYRDRRIK